MRAQLVMYRLAGSHEAKGEQNDSRILLVLHKGDSIVDAVFLRGKPTSQRLSLLLPLFGSYLLPYRRTCITLG